MEVSVFSRGQDKAAVPFGRFLVSCLSGEGRRKKRPCWVRGVFPRLTGQRFPRWGTRDCAGAKDGR